MKLYSEFQNASIKMKDNFKLKNAISSLASKNKIQIIIESGTYLGNGSTKILAENFENIEKIFTCEVNKEFYKTAKKNLKKYKNVKCLNGRTVPYKDAIDFIQNDSIFNELEKYPEIFIDDIINPREFYIKEIKGFLNTRESLTNRFFFNKNDNLLTHLIEKNIDKSMMIVLDSSGGIGFFEFKLVKEKLKNKPYYILLDDIHHLKHFRSYNEIKKNKHFKIIEEDYENGWALSQYSPIV